MASVGLWEIPEVVNNTARGLRTALLTNKGIPVTPQKSWANQFVALLYPLVAMHSTLLSMRHLSRCRSTCLDHVHRQTASTKPGIEVRSWLPSSRSSYVLRMVWGWGGVWWLNTTLMHWLTIPKAKRGWRRQSSLRKGKPQSGRKNPVEPAAIKRDTSFVSNLATGSTTSSGMEEG